MRKVLALLLLVGSTMIFAEEIKDKKKDNELVEQEKIQGDYDFRASFPILEFPHNASENFITDPSMSSTIGYVDGLTQGAHYWEGHFDYDKRLKLFTIAATDFVFAFSTTMWLHEQGHSAIMNHNGFNTKIKFMLGAAMTEMEEIPEAEFND
ncbi:MAG: hypothetical protein ACRC0V_06675, partial [Fusobacteriaceae bacterium]